MVNTKRVFIATVFGIIAGIICNFLGGLYTEGEITTMLYIYTLANRALIGFVIGISAYKIHWTPHGILMGLIVSIPFTIGTLLGEVAVAFSLIGILITLMLNAAYGFMIELFTSVVFKTPMEST
jgi:hypothetical protein